MSREIDPHNMSADDVEYVRQRPSLHREFILQGFGDPLADDYEGLNFTPESDDSDNPENPMTPVNENPEDAETEDDGEDEEESEEEDEEDEGHSSTVSSLDELPEAKRWNKSMTKGQLNGVVLARNADYDPDEQIIVEEDKKDAFLAALEQDDRELLGSEE